MAELGSSTVYGDIKVNGAIIGDLDNMGSGITAGTAAAYTFSSNNFTLKDGAILVLKLHIANDKGATLNVNDTGAKTIIDALGKPIPKGFLINSIITVVYNGTNFIIQGGGSGGGGGGIILNASDLNIANVSTQVQNVGGYEKSFVNPPSTVTSVVNAAFEDLLYGTYSVIVRMAINNISSTANILKLEAFHVVGATETLINTAYVKPSSFTTAGKYQTLGFVTDFAGSGGLSSPKLLIKVSTVSHATQYSIYFDYIRVAPANTAQYALPTA